MHRIFFLNELYTPLLLESDLPPSSLFSLFLVSGSVPGQGAASADGLTVTATLEGVSVTATLEGVSVTATLEGVSVTVGDVSDTVTMMKLTIAKIYLKSLV